VALSDDLGAVKTLVTSSWANNGGAPARDAGGLRVEISDPAAVTFNLVGACAKVAAGDVVRLRAMLDAIRDANQPDGLVGFDGAPGRTRGQMVSMLASLIASSVAHGLAKKG
jgi:hypothetical protein